MAAGGWRTAWRGAARRSWANTKKKVKHGKLTLETISSRVLVIHCSGRHGDERIGEVGCGCVDERFWSCARLPGRAGRKQSGRKDGGNAVESGWALSHPARFFLLRKKAPLYVKGRLEWQASGQRNANTIECTARTMQMEGPKVRLGNGC